MSTSPTITMRSAGDLVAVLPYLLGYHPRDSLVLVCLREGQVCLTACQPLPPGGEPPPALDALLAGMAKADPEAVIILGNTAHTAVARLSHCPEISIRSTLRGRRRRFGHGNVINALLAGTRRVGRALALDPGTAAIGRPG